MCGADSTICYLTPIYRCKYNRYEFVFIPKYPNLELIGYTDAGYLSDPRHGRSQTSYLFKSGDATISWRSVKQTIIATSSNHAVFLASQVKNVFG